jgi:hypothetical protein
MGMHDVDALGRDQVLQCAGIAAQAEQVAGGVGEIDPLPAKSLELADQRPIGGRHQGARTSLYQRMGDIDGGACLGRLDHRRHDLQYGGVGERAPRHSCPLEAVAHECRRVIRW